MNREMKYRVWDKVKKIWIEWEDVFAYRLMTPFMSDSRYLVYEYVGKKDLNGRDVYVGHVVNCFRDTPSIVSFRAGSFGLMTGDSFTPFHEIYGFMEIMGDIHTSFPSYNLDTESVVDR